MDATNREQWKSVDGFANYEISNCGRVRNATTERILKHTDNGKGYLRVSLCKNSKVFNRMFHVIFANAFIENPHNKRCVDHIDGNTKNNCIENLRFATHSENLMNKRGHKNTSSVYKGVSFDKNSGKWVVRIKVDGVYKNMGLFEIEKEAAEVYNAAALKFYKEFAKLNELD